MRILFVEDHSIVREGMRLVLTHHFPGCTLVEAASAQEAVTQVTKGRWDIILADIDLPDRSGIDLLADLRNLAPKTPVLILSGGAESEMGEIALRAGAAGFLPKTSRSDELATAIKRLLAGKRYITQDLAALIAGRGGQGTDQAPHLSLSPRELEVLRLLGRGLTPSGVGDRLGVSVKTVSTYRARLLEKLSLATTGELVRYAVMHGLVN